MTPTKPTPRTEVTKSSLDRYTAAEPSPRSEYISLSDVFRTLRNRAAFLCLFTVITTAIATVVVFVIPSSYKAEAAIVPPQQPQSTLSSLLASAVGGSAIGGVASQLGLKTQTDLYVGILKSRTIADSVIEQFGLQQVYGKATLSETRNALARHANIEAGKDTLIHISIEDREPKRAVDLANAYLDELYKQNSKLALTESSQRRVFFEQQMAAERTALTDAESRLKNSQESSGLVMPSGQAEALIRSSAQLRAQLVAKQVELETTRSFATDQNPRITLLEREIKTLQDQIRNVESSGSGLQVPASRLPSAGLDYARKLREVKAHEAALEFLAKQYEAAFIDEAKSAPVIQVVDRPVLPDRRSWPPRLILILSSACAGFIIASVIALLRTPRQT